MREKKENPKIKMKATRKKCKGRGLKGAQASTIPSGF